MRSTPLFGAPRAARRVCAVLGLLLLGLAWPAAGANLYQLGSRWLDDHAQSVQFTQFRGRMSVVSMAYGACTKICSTTLRRLEQLQELADARHVELEFILVGLDPRVDNAEAWRGYRRSHHLERDNWHFIAGDPGATRLVAQMLGIDYWIYDDHVLHDFGIVLVSPDGEIVRRMRWQNESLERFLSALPAAPLAAASAATGMR